MTVKEYLHQAYRLDQRIKSDTLEAQNLREMAGSVSGLRYDVDRVQTSKNTDAPFVRALERLWELENKVADELALLSDLKKQIREVIETVPDTDERMKCRMFTSSSTPLTTRLSAPCALVVLQLWHKMFSLPWMKR